MKFSALWGIFVSPLLGLVIKPLHSCSDSPLKEQRNLRGHQGQRALLTWSLQCRRRCTTLRAAVLLLRVFSLALAIYWLNLRGCLGPQHPVKIGFAEPGLPVSGQVRFKQGGSLHQTALSSWISGPGTTPSSRRKTLTPQPCARVLRPIGASLRTWRSPTQFPIHSHQRLRRKFTLQELESLTLRSVSKSNGLFGWYSSYGVFDPGHGRIGALCAQLDPGFRKPRTRRDICAGDYEANGWCPVGRPSQFSSHGHRRAGQCWKSHKCFWAFRGVRGPRNACRWRNCVTDWRHSFGQDRRLHGGGHATPSRIHGGRRGHLCLRRGFSLRFSLHRCFGSAGEDLGYSHFRTAGCVLFPRGARGSRRPRCNSAAAKTSCQKGYAFRKWAKGKAGHYSRVVHTAGGSFGDAATDVPAVDLVEYKTTEVGGSAAHIGQERSSCSSSALGAALDLPQLPVSALAKTLQPPHELRLVRTLVCWHPLDSGNHWS